MIALAPVLLGVIGTALVVVISSTKGSGHPHSLRVAGGGSSLRVRVSSDSMVPAINPGAVVHVAVSRAYAPSVGDIVYFHPPAGADTIQPVCGNPNQGAGHAQACDKPTAAESSETFIKRVVAGPGDTVFIDNGHLYRNGVRERDSYIEPCGADPACNFRAPITIPPGDYFVLGDDRGVSDDSRFWGPVPRSFIIGRVER